MIKSLNLLIFSFAILLTNVAFAACSSPTGSEGDVIYSAAAKQLQFCNGTNWVNTGATVQSLGGGGFTLYENGNPIGPVIGYVQSYGPAFWSNIYNFHSTATANIGSTINTTSYYSQSNCGGYVMGILSNGYGYSCIGADTCTHGVIRFSTPTESLSYGSSRNSSGVCSNISGTATMYTKLSVWAPCLLAGISYSISDKCSVQ
jgi:hypothetical protein